MDRMGSLDAVFVAVEDAVNHMHIGSVGFFEGPPPSYDELRALVAAKLPLVPRYRQRVREAPFSIGRPLWIDDVHFNLDYHLRMTALPAHAGRNALEHLVGRIMSQRLDRCRPLWEMWVIEGLPDDQWAIISKVHHCMVDGIAGTDLLGVVMDAERDAPLVIADEWVPRPEPSRTELARTTLEMAIESLRNVATGVASAVVHPIGALRWVRDVASGTEGIVVPGAHAGQSLMGPIGPHRRWVRTKVPLDDVKTVRSVFGGTVNDVVLAAVAGGFRRLLLERGEMLDESGTVTTLIPVSMRTADARGVLDNRVSAVYAHLPVGIDDPVERLHAVRADMIALKQSHEIDASAAIVQLGDIVPPIVSAALARTLVHSQGFVQTVATNVPGPQFPLYLCGRQMLEAYPYVPIAGHIRVGVAIWSYRGTLYFGVTGDWDGAPDIDRVAAGITGTFSELCDAALAAVV